MEWKIAATVLASVGGLLGLSAIYDQLGFDPSRLRSFLMRRSTAIRVLMLALVGLPGFILSRIGIIPTRVLWDLLPASVPLFLASLFVLYLFIKAILRVVRVLSDYRKKRSSKEWREIVWTSAIVSFAMVGLSAYVAIRRPTLVVEWLAFGLSAGVLGAMLVYGPIFVGEVADWFFPRKVPATTLAVLLLLASSLIQIWAM